MFLCHRQLLPTSLLKYYSLKEKSGRFSAVSRGKYNILWVYNLFPDDKRPSESFTISFRKNKVILRVRIGREQPRVGSVPGCIAHDVVASLSSAQSNTLCLSQLYRREWARCVRVQIYLVIGKFALAGVLLPIAVFVSSGEFWYLKKYICICQRWI